MTYTVKRVVLEKTEKEQGTETLKSEKAETEHENEQKNEVCRRAVMRMLGLVLIVMAAVFAGFLADMPAPAAYISVFSYLMIQTYLWLG